MTTNDKPVCWQCRALFPDGQWSIWYTYDNERDRDSHVKADERLYYQVETRDLYARPQPAAPQVPGKLALARGEHATGYVEGWNACIDSMLATPPAAKPERPIRDAARFICMEESEQSKTHYVQPAGDDAVTVPREVVAAYARSTHIPRHRRICEEALTKPAGEAVDAEDAARYRWLRDAAKTTDFTLPRWTVALEHSGMGRTYRGEELDAAIDHARRLSGQEG